MKQKLISDAERDRLARYAKIRDQFQTYNGAKTLVIKEMAKELKISSATIYKALKARP